MTPYPEAPLRFFLHRAGFTLYGAKSIRNEAPACPTLSDWDERHGESFDQTAWGKLNEHS